VTEINGRVESLLAETLNIPAAGITDGLAMQDVGSWDSLKHMELIVALEQGFGIDFTFEEIVEMTSVGEIKRVLREKSAVA